MKKLLVITGQTATGKTELARVIAQKYRGELVSSDARQAYTHLDIVTGKDIEQCPVQKHIIEVEGQKKSFVVYEKEGIPIWLYDVKDPKEYLTAYEWVKCAEAVIKNIQKRGKLPIVVGGTAFYIQKLLEGFDLHIPPNWKLRASLESLSVGQLKKRLVSVNEARFLSMNQSDRQNPRRLIRAIEIGSSLPKKRESAPYDALLIGLFLEKYTLYSRIKERVEKRIEKGAIAETRQLLDVGYSFDDPGFHTLGYQQLRGYIERGISESKIIEEWICKEVAYGKRQLTFIKKMKKIHLFQAGAHDLLANVVQLIYKW